MTDNSSAFALYITALAAMGGTYIAFGVLAEVFDIRLTGVSLILLGFLWFFASVVLALVAKRRAAKELVKEVPR